MKRAFVINLAVGAVLAASCVGCGGGGNKRLNAGGSTFVYPMMSKWADEYKKAKDVEVNYQSIGSGGGIQQMTAKTFDFGGTDGPMNDEQVKKCREQGSEPLHIPLVMGAVVPAYNLTEVKETLRFSGPLLADIFLGNVKKWNDKAIKELNPKVADQLPDKEIVVVHRSDGSGTTYVWVDYLAKVSPEWSKKVGVGTDLSWPVGVAAAGNGGVAKKVKETPGSIGYVELSYAFRLDLKMGLVRNRENEFVRAGLESVRTAADNGLTNVPDDLRLSLTDAPGKGSYPICGTTWAMVYVNQRTDKGRRLLDFLYWAVDSGQDEADLLLYVRMPESLNRLVHDQLKRIQVDK